MHKIALVAFLLAGCKLGGGGQWSTQSSGGSSSPLASPPSSSSSGSGPTSSGSSGASRAEAAGWRDPGMDAHEERDRRRAFRSTRDTAAKLHGLPGMPCAEADKYMVPDGECWDPPGGTRALPMAHLQPGMRQIQKVDWSAYEKRAVYWFDMPREAVVGYEKYPELPDTGKNPPVGYGPYDDQGFERPPLPKLLGRTVDEVVADFDKLDMPFVLEVRWIESCDAGGGTHDRVCEVDTRNDNSSLITIRVLSAIRKRGTPDEERRLPDKLEGRPTAEVVAELKQLGFTVNVIEKPLPCNRGVVCGAPRAGWHKVSQPVEIEVRPPPKAD